MIGKARHHRRGSVVIMVVGLLTLLAMIGSTLVIVSFLDRREARSIAATVPMKNVAGSVLGRVLVRLTDDLYISDNGTPTIPSDDVLYGAIAADDADAVEKRIDYPAETVDKHLASFDLHYDTASGYYVWKHVSNIPGDLSNPANVRLVDPRLADTDRAAYTVGPRYWGDSLLWDSGMKDSADRHLMVATRVVDAGGLLAVNLAHRPAAATHEMVMPITDLSLVPLLDDTPGDAVLKADTVASARFDDDLPPALPLLPGTIVKYWNNYALRPNNVGADQKYYPFTVEDMLAATWFTTLPRPSTGRLHSVLTSTGDFAAARRYLTVASVGRIGVAPGRTSDIPAAILTDLRALTRQLYKVDLNEPNPKVAYPALFNAFYNLLTPLALPPISDEPRRRTAAAQMAVNVIDFLDTDSDPTGKKVPGVDDVPGAVAYVFGVERQPFLVEAAYKREKVGGDIDEYYAIELFNPFETDINISGWQVKVGTAAPVLLSAIPGDPSPGDPIRARGRLVIVNDATGVKVPVGVRKKEFGDLDLTQDVLILRPCVVDGTTHYIVMDSITPGEFFTNPTGDPEAGTPKLECLRRDDVLPHAFYALRLYNTTAIRDDITTPAGAANLGAENVGVKLPKDTKPCPVYVRNGNFINVAEVCRIFAIGPGKEVSLSEGLTETASFYNGRLDMAGHVPDKPSWDAGIPLIPPGCVPWDFLMVHSPMADGVDNNGDGQTDNAGEDLVYGRVNINTAPHRVLECLPSLARMIQADRDKIIREILCYRDLEDNTVAMQLLPGSGGGLPYKTYGRAHKYALDIANLRGEPGFASPGEIVLPLLARASKADITAENRLPKDTYSSNQAPDNYTVSDGGTTDDGLSAAATKVSGDLVKHHVYASWLSNHVTVRSDVYLAYIAVYASTAEGSGTIKSVGGNTLGDTTKRWKDNKWLRDRTQEELLHVVVWKKATGETEIRRITGNDATDLTVATAWSGVAAGDRYQILSVKRRHVALIDRSNVRSVRDRPEVLMFAEVR